MCGICGILSFGHEVLASPELLRKMCRTLTHRGPDDEGIYCEGRIGLGMRRLSIIDLKTGHQPLANEDETIWVVQNGEIYNFPTLKEELKEKGHSFRTKTDTEVLVHAYEEWGEDFAKKLRGMFAFALWDKKKQTLILGRDRLGKKPLFYTVWQNHLIFASEIKALLAAAPLPRQVNLAALDTYLTLEYIPSPETIFVGVKKLLPAHLLLWRNGQGKLSRYWQIDLHQPLMKNKEEAKFKLYETLKEAVRIRLISDVPLGAFLSGGLDSTAVVGLMSEIGRRPVKTFSIGFADQSYNELDYARLAAKKYQTEHQELMIEPKVAELVEKLIHYLDEPLADFSIFPTYLVSQLARHKVKVALSGDGGDEQFFGYEHYLAQKLALSFDLLPTFGRQILAGIFSLLPAQEQKRGAVNILKRFFEGLALPKNLEHLRWQTFLHLQGKKKLYAGELLEELNRHNPYARAQALAEEAYSLDSLARQGYIDLNCYLIDDIMVKVDRMSMANSLETRAPLMDQKFVQMASQIPSHQKIAFGKSKAILRDTFSDLYPEEIRRRGKQGFSIPIKNWLRGELREKLLHNLSPERIKKRGYFSPEYIQQLVRQHLSGRFNHSHKLWALLIFELWQQIFVDQRP